MAENTTITIPSDSDDSARTDEERESGTDYESDNSAYDGCGDEADNRSCDELDGTRILEADLDPGGLEIEVDEDPEPQDINVEIEAESRSEKWKGKKSGGHPGPGNQRSTGNQGQKNPGSQKGKAKGKGKPNNPNNNNKGKGPWKESNNEKSKDQGSKQHENSSTAAKNTPNTTKNAPQLNFSGKSNKSGTSGSKNLTVQSWNNNNSSSNSSSNPKGHSQSAGQNPNNQKKPNKGGNNNNNNNNSNNNNNNNNSKSSSNSNKKDGEPPPKDILKETRSIMNMFFKKRQTCSPLDGIALFLHYRVSVTLFVLLFTIVQGNWIWRDSIHCVYGHNAEAVVAKHVKNYCLSYSYICESFIDKDNCHQRYILFYRWIHFSLLIVAGCFYFPRIIAKKVDNPRLKQLLHDLALDAHKYDGGKWEHNTQVMLRYMKNHISSHDSIYFWLIICHLLALAIDCLVVFYLDWMLHGRFVNLGYSAYPFHRDPRTFMDDISRTFPPFVNCTLTREILINNQRVDHLGCHLILMDLYDKMFLVVWLWLLLLIVITFIKVLSLFLLAIPPFNRLLLIVQASSKGVLKLRNKLLKKCRFSDVYALHLLKCYCSEAQFVMFMAKFIHCSEESIDEVLGLTGKDSRGSVKDEVFSSVDNFPESLHSTEKKWLAKNTNQYNPDLTPILPKGGTVRFRVANSSTPNFTHDADPYGMDVISV